MWMLLKEAIFLLIWRIQEGVNWTFLIWFWHRGISGHNPKEKGWQGKMLVAVLCCLSIHTFTPQIWMEMGYFVSMNGLHLPLYHLFRIILSSKSKSLKDCYSSIYELISTQHPEGRTSDRITSQDLRAVKRERESRTEHKSKTRQPTYLTTYLCHGEMFHAHLSDRQDQLPDPIRKELPW